MDGDAGIEIVIQRRRAGMKQWELARALGISATRLSLFETGRAEPPEGLLDRVRSLVESRKAVGS